MFKDRKISTHIYFLVTVVFCVAALAQNQEITLSKFEPGEIQFAGFTLKSDKSISIKAVGAGTDKAVRRTRNNVVDPQNQFAYAWIIDARTRELKWRMTPQNTESDWWGAKYNRTFNGNVPLKKGEYEVYYAAFHPVFLATEDGYFSLKKIWGKVFGDEDWWEENSAEWKIAVTNLDEVFSQNAVLKYQRAVKKSAIVDLTGVRDSEEVKQGFTLKKSALLTIYAVGEGFEGEMFDFAYIVDANSRKRVWTMDERKTEYAGGALKNRVVRQEIEFDAGNYLVYFQCDDSHASGEWNANPPYDPNFYGITISGTGEKFDPNVVYKFEGSEGAPVVELDRLRDYEEVSEGFTLTKPLSLRIYAIGEGHEKNMADFGWIENARTGKRIWEMDYHNTEHAGGADKNRRFDGVVQFDAGSYIAYFITDDSHAYNSWNSARPLDPAGWGMKIFTLNKKDEEFVRKYEPELDKNILVQIVRVGDDEHIERQFNLERDSEVRIYAIGEGDRDEMYDYAWIDDYNTGRTVWKMNYRETRRAGGASKNRLFDGMIHLRKGSYLVNFVSDDSHSYGDWNTAPPRDQRNWGITIYSINPEQSVD